MKKCDKLKREENVKKSCKYEEEQVGERRGISGEVQTARVAAGGGGGGGEEHTGGGDTCKRYMEE